MRPDLRFKTLLKVLLFIVFLDVCFKITYQVVHRYYWISRNGIKANHNQHSGAAVKTVEKLTDADEPWTEETETEMETMTVEEIREEIYSRNREQHVWNAGEWGGRSSRLALGPHSIVIVVQVHDRPKYLQRLIASLSTVRGINRTLIIFSHDVFSPQMNKMVENITFCPVMQIFYPYSPQLFPDRFPGQSAPALNCSQQGNDSNSGKDTPVNSQQTPSPSPRQLSQSAPQKERSVPKILNHLNSPNLPQSMPNLSSYSSDLKQSARNGSDGNVKMRYDCAPYVPCALCQAKHHWAWKLNFVFQAVRRLRGYEGHVMLLEEDYYVTRDLLHTARLLPTSLNNDLRSQIKRTLRGRPGMVIFAMACLNTPKRPPAQWSGGEATLRVWEPRYNKGMLFTKRLWLDLSLCAKQFCQYEDYNWDWSLFNVSLTCFQRPLLVAALKFMRVHHMGLCVGMHNNLWRSNRTAKSKQWCDLNKAYGLVETYLDVNKRLLFPKKLNYDSMVFKSKITIKPYGSWNNAWDYDLCESFFTVDHSKKLLTLDLDK